MSNVTSSGPRPGSSAAAAASSRSLRKARPSTTPSLIGSRREPTSIRIVRGLDASSSQLSFLHPSSSSSATAPSKASAGTPTRSSRAPASLTEAHGSDNDSVIIDEEIESCGTSPVKRPTASSGHTSVAVSAPALQPPAVATLAAAPIRPNTASAAQSRPRRINLGRKELLGAGSFGKVYRAMDMDTNRILAVKEIPLVGSAREVAQLRKEILLLQKFDHPHIVKCLGEHVDDCNNMQIYLEYIPGGSLSSILRSFGPLRESQASSFMRQLLEGLAYLHAKTAAHRDVKCENLLIDVDGHLKLADFGAARELHSEAKSVTGTASHMAPEIIRGTGHGTAADVWSVGCVAVEMLTGRPPFHAFKNQYAIMMHVAESQDDVFESIIPPRVSASGKAFMRRCLVRDPSKRATAAALLRDPWILDPPVGDRDEDGTRGAAASFDASTATATTNRSTTAPSGLEEGNSANDVTRQPSNDQSCSAPAGTVGEPASATEGGSHDGDPAPIAHRPCRNESRNEAAPVLDGMSFNPMQSFSDDL